MYWSHVSELLAAADGNENESYVVDLHVNDETEPLPRIFSLWCRGFVRSFELWPDAWVGALGQPELEPHFALLRSWARAGETPTGKLYPPEEDAENQITSAVIALYRATKPEREDKAKHGPPV